MAAAAGGFGLTLTPDEVSELSALPAIEARGMKSDPDNGR